MKTGVIEWASAMLPLPGQTECGDRHVIVPVSDGVVVGVVDGVGHGREAAAAAECVVETIEAHVRNVPLVELVRRCHTNLQSTRGAVMSLVMFDENRTMTWVGVGDVEGRLMRNNDVGDRLQKSLLLRPGVVGERLPPLYPAVLPLARNDTVILATDGVEGRFTEGIKINEPPPQQIADTIIDRHSKRTDDALVLVARYGG